MVRYTLFFFLLLFVASCSEREQGPSNDQQDSVERLLDAANADSLSIEERQRAAVQALKIIETETHDSLYRAQLFRIANRYFNMNLKDRYKDVTEKIVAESLKAKDSSSLAKAYSYKGDYFGEKLMSDSAYWYYNKAENIYRALGENASIAQSLLNKGIQQSNENDLIGSEKSVVEALKFLRSVDDDMMAYEANNILAILYNSLGEYDKAISYHGKALELASSKDIYKEYQGVATSLNNLGYVYRNMNRHDLAVAKFLEALAQPDLKQDKIPLYAILKDNLAYSKFKMGDGAGLPSLFYESLKISDSLKIIPNIISTKLHLSEYYHHQGDKARALRYAGESYDMAKSYRRPSDQLPALALLSKIQPSREVAYSREFIRVNDSLQRAEKKIRNKLARIEYETDELVKEKGKLEEQQKTLIYIALGVILLGVLIFVIRYQAEKNRELRMIQEQQKANEEIYQLMINQQNKIEEVRQAEKKRIAQELHDGVLGKLFGTRMNLGILNTKTDPEGIGERSVYIDELKILEEELREISHDLSTEKTAVFNNFVLMVSNFVASQRAVCSAAIHYTIDPKIQWNTVDNMAKINFYRILQEALQNINKYAKAQNVHITFTLEKHSIALTIVDDGVGFKSGKKRNGIGLQNMLSRIKSLNGSMSIETEPGRGVQLRFELPLTNHTN